MKRSSLPSDAAREQRAAECVDQGLLSPVTADVDRERLCDDATIARALVATEVALVRAWGAVGTAPGDVVNEVSEAFGWTNNDGAEGIAEWEPQALSELTAAAVAGGNPVIPLVGRLKRLAPERGRAWIHRGATSQDILDSALMLVARSAALDVLAALVDTDERLTQFASAHRDVTAAARTLTQHAVPTTIGARAATWARAVRRAAVKLDDAIWQLPAQLGGAAGTLASFVEIGGAAAARELPARFADELGLAVPDAPWHTTRWPVTELGDALVQATSALGVIAADVATLSRTEIGELAEGTGGGSSAMPQKQNPTRSVLMRSAALRAPQLGATLHTAAALAVDERPDGAWHAEWPTLRELLRLAAGTAEHGVQLVSGLRVDEGRVAENLARTGGLIVAERLSLVLGPVLGAARVGELVALAGTGADMGALLRAEPAVRETDIDALLDPAHYLGLSGDFVDALADDFEWGGDAGTEPTGPTEPTESTEPFPEQPEETP